MKPGASKRNGRRLISPPVGLSSLSLSFGHTPYDMICPIVQTSEAGLASGPFFSESHLIPRAAFALMPLPLVIQYRAKA